MAGTGIVHGDAQAALPQGGEAESAFGRVAVAYGRDGDAVTVETTIALTTPRVSPEQYPAFREWVQRADGLGGDTIWFEISSTSADAAWSGLDMMRQLLSSASPPTVGGRK